MAAYSPYEYTPLRNSILKNSLYENQLKSVEQEKRKSKMEYKDEVLGMEEKFMKSKLEREKSEKQTVTTKTKEIPSYAKPKQRPQKMIENSKEKKIVRNEKINFDLSKGPNVTISKKVTPGINPNQESKPRKYIRPVTVGKL